MAMLAIGCGGSQGSTHLQHPVLDQDYASRFVGTWSGSATVVLGGQTQTLNGNQPIAHADFNRLSIVEVCSNLSGLAGLDSATTFSMDPVTCPPVTQSCGPVTLRYDSGTGSLAQDTLTVTLKGIASGCGQSLPFTATFTGQLPGSGSPGGGSGPIQPPPADLWQPTAGATPASGNFVYLESDPGDYIGAGNNYTYAPPAATISVTASSSLLSVGVGGWSGQFKGMSSISQLQPGYYPSLQRYPFHDPARGGLSWSGQGRGCNTLTGWFVVDGVTYSGPTLTAIDLRFEQHCEGGAPALRGKVHWTAP